MIDGLFAIPGQSSVLGEFDLESLLGLEVGLVIGVYCAERAAYQEFTSAEHESVGIGIDSDVFISQSVHYILTLPEIAHMLPVHKVITLGITCVSAIAVAGLESLLPEKDI
jgi:hypothetical protein